MQSNPSHRWLPPLTGLALAMCASCAHAATGVRVLLQAWDPRTPDAENVITLIDQPTLVSDSLQDAWDRARPKICEQLRNRMGVGKAAHGETLRDITCLLDDRVVLDVAPAGQNALRASFAVSGYVEATSTTPDVVLGVGFDESLDPRFSVALTAKLELILAVQSSREQTLRVSKAQFTLNNATLDSQGFTGDMLKFVAGDLVPFFGGPDYKRMAEDAVNAVSVDFASDFNGAMAPVNAKLTGPSDAVRVGVSGSANYISAAFAPREFTPLTNGRMTGMIRWDAAQFTPRDGCNSFEIRATVQTGPVPMYTPNASAPTRDVGTLQISPVDAGSCAFTMSGLAAGWPNILTARLVGPYVAKSAGNAVYRVSFGMRGDGWNGRVVVPAPLAEARNYLVSRSVDATATEALGSAAAKKTYRTDPRINPEQFNTLQVDPAAGKTIGPRASDHVSQQVEAVSLNPQPLPPDPDPTVQTSQTRKASAVKRLKSTTSQPIVEDLVVVP